MIRVLQALLVAAAIALGVTAVSLRADEAVEKPQVSADAPLDAAQHAVETFFGLAPGRARRGMATLKEISTETFAADFRAQRQRLLRELNDRRLVLVVKVPDTGAAVEFLTPDQAWVLVAADVVSTSAEGTSATTKYRVRVQLKHEDEEWLVAGMEQIA
ncbi:hypothetical protein [Nocardioides sp. R-C-SC26]|uniref:hypothetical protein n=1 Tax=Nocardioides sp. R-C-SC26 TaxID=2870414 RepID=UPI001E379F80|nr:hypothetical protein [Nocardioides sp. R-C-SC26]